MQGLIVWGHREKARASEREGRNSEEVCVIC